MNEVNKTLYIPLYGKAYVTEKGLLLDDPKAVEIWNAEGFPLKGKSKSKWLAYYMAMRAKVFDRWVEQKLRELPGAAVLHLGCGMDSRCLRVAHGDAVWYDVDFPDVIQVRRRYYEENENYRMISGDAREGGWLQQIPGNQAIVVMEGISMYLSHEELKAVMENLYGRFEKLEVLMDCYSEFAAKMSKYKNPINDVGVTEVYGMDDPRVLEHGDLRYWGELDMTPGDLIDQLPGWEQKLFRKLYAGKSARKLYRMYAYRKEA